MPPFANSFQPRLLRGSLGQAHMFGNQTSYWRLGIGSDLQRVDKIIFIRNVRILGIF